MINLDKFCRTCFSHGVLFAATSKCNINSELITVQDMLRECTDINISNADCLPKRMCASCIVGVRTSYTFRLQSLQTQKCIVELLNNLKSGTSDVTHDMVISLKDTNIKQYKKSSSNATNQGLNVLNCSDLNISINENIDNFENDTTESNQYVNIALEHCFNPIINHNQYTDSDHSMHNDLPLLDHVDEHRSGEIFETEHKSSTNNKQQKFKIDHSRTSLDRLGLETNRKRVHRPFACSCGAKYVRKSNLLTHFKLQGHFSPGVQSTSGKVIFKDPLDIDPHSSECDYNDDSIKPEPIFCHDDASVEVKIEPEILLDSLEDKDETRPYVCECGRSYVRKSDLVRHCKHKKHEVRKKNMDRSVFAAKKWPQITIVNDKQRSPMVKREVIDRQDGQEELDDNQHVNNIHVEDSDIFAFAVNIDSSDENSIMEVGRTGKPYKYLCTCGTKYCRKSDFVRHVKWKHIKAEHYPEPEAIGDLFTCSECRKVLNTMENFEAHVETTHRQVPCDICGIVLYGTLKAEAHQKRQHNTPHTCSVCHKICSTRNSLKSHHRQHLQFQQHLCSYCGKGFRSASLLMVHIRTHTNERPYNCLFNDCGKAFYTKSLLTAHRRTHTQDRPFACEHCPRRFTMVGNLNIHKRIHSGEKPYKCSICPGTFRTKSTLSTHLLVHSGEQPFACGICDRRFAIKSALRSHIRRHLQDKPHKCHYCDYASCTKDHLTYHTRIHTGERPYPCHYKGCTKSFINNNRLRRHVRELHDGMGRLKNNKKRYGGPTEVTSLTDVTSVLHGEINNYGIKKELKEMEELVVDQELKETEKQNQNMDCFKSMFQVADNSEFAVLDNYEDGYYGVIDETYVLEENSEGYYESNSMCIEETESNIQCNRAGELFCLDDESYVRVLQ